MIEKAQLFKVLTVRESDLDQMPEVSAEEFGQGPLADGPFKILGSAYQGHWFVVERGGNFYRVKRMVLFTRCFSLVDWRKVRREETKERAAEIWNRARLETDEMLTNDFPQIFVR